MFFKAVLTLLYAVMFIDCGGVQSTSRSSVSPISLRIKDKGSPISKIGQIAFSADLCHETVVLGAINVDCSSRLLSIIPTLPKNSSVIRLDNNTLSYVNATPFRGMTILQSLNLSHNSLQYISPDIFKGLGYLNHLFIAQSELYNQVGLDLKYLFSDLKQLKELVLTFRPFSVNFHCTLNLFLNIEVLKDISILEIDTILMKGFSKQQREPIVARTTVLTLRCTACSYPDETRLESKIFSGFSSLKKLICINAAKHFFLENDSFNGLHQLEELFITSGQCAFGKNDGSVDQVIHNISTSAVTLTRLRVLGLENIACILYKSNLDCSIAFSALVSSKSLKRISLNNNALTMFDCLFVSKPYFPKSLTHLDIRGNSLFSLALTKLVTLHPHIEYIDARYQNKGGALAHLKKYGENNDQNKHIISHNFDNKRKFKYTLRSSSLREIYLSHTNNPYYWFQFSPYLYVNLTRVEYSWLKDFKRDTLYIPDSFFDSRPALNYLDATGAGIGYIQRNAFRNASKLETLHMSSNVLGKMGPALSKVLGCNTALRNLYLANNGIDVLTKDIFSTMTYLQQLDVSRNHLTVFLPSVQHLKHLKILNISHNNIQILSSKTQKDLDEIRTASILKIDMTGNPILCTCETLSFLRWMANTKVILWNKHKYTCSHANGHVTVMESIDKVISSLDYSCASRTIQNVTISASVALFIAVVTSGLGYRYRWRVRYLYYMAKLRFVKTTPEYERLFDYDALISYATEDFQIARTGCIQHLENERGLKLCIHERDFQPGQAIAFNISVGIHSSKKTVLFISESFLQSKWCMYELNMARMESLYTERAVMLIVILETSAINRMPVDVLDLIRTITYLEYPEHEGDDDVMIFWSKLTEFIKR